MSTKEFDIKGFTRIAVRFAMEIEVLRGETYNVSISGSDTVIENMNVSLEGDKLVLGYRLNLASIVAAPFSRTSAKITLPQLEELDISGAARGSVQGFNSDKDFKLHVAGASQLTISDTAVGNMHWQLSGASHIRAQVKAAGNADIKIEGASWMELTGAAQDISVDASGASHIELANFPVRNAKFRLTGASRSNVTMTGKLDVDLEGASRLEYDGQPVMGEVKVTGASTLKRR